MKTFTFLLLFINLLYVQCFSEKSGSICLNMIVKNEKNVIKRCLESVKSIIDYWVIVDTGSTDGTQEIITEFMKDVPGELHECPWKNFEYNRNIALNLAKEKAMYILFMDADDKLSFPQNFKMPKLIKDSYNIEIVFGNMNYYRPLIVKNSLPWKWKGVLHEAIICDKGFTSAKLPGIKNIVSTDGARSKDPLKYQKDAEVLENALKNEPNNSRYRFYLAQSYKDYGNSEKSIENYQKRIEMKGWDQEVFYSMYQVGISQQKLKVNPEKFIESYFRAFFYRPTRLEPLHEILTYFRKVGNYRLGYCIGKMGEHITSTSDLLFVGDWIYKYGFLLELSICAYWIGKHEECKYLSEKILRIPNLPNNVVSCVKRNLHFAEEKILTLNKK